MWRLVTYVLNWLRLIDQALNTIIGGDPRMTLSARMGRDIEQGKCRLCFGICKLLALIDKHHCQDAWIAQRQRPDPSHQITKE